MSLRILVRSLAKCLFKRDADRLLDLALQYYENGKLRRGDWEAFCDIALAYRTWLLE